MTDLFSAAQLQRVLTETLPEVLPAGHTNAIVVRADDTGAHIATLVSLGSGGHWQIKAAGEYLWTGEKRIGLEVIDSW